MSKRILQFGCGVFAVIARVIDGEVRLLVNVRTDRERQLGLANLPSTSTVEIVDLPGGTLDTDDKTLQDCLRREVHEETNVEQGGIRILQWDPLLCAPFINLGEEIQNIAMVWPVTIEGEPSPSNEAAKNLWVSEAEITAGETVRCPGKNKHGRMYQLMMAGFKYWGDVYHEQTMSAKSGN